MLLNKQVQTDRTFRKNKPDIIMCDTEKPTGVIIDLQFQEREM